MREGWGEVPLTDFAAIVRRTEPIDPVGEYKQVTLAINGKGARLRRTCRGDELGSAKYSIRSGDLLVSKIDARKGAAAIVPVALDGAVVTGDFPSFEVNPELVDLTYLDLLVRRREFAESADSISAGTTNRVRMDMKRLSEITLLLPPLVEQRRIVDLIAAVDENITAADTLTESAQAARSSLFSELLAAGGADWEERTLEEVAVVNPKEPPLEESDPFIPMDAVQACGRWVTYTEPRGRRGGARARAGDTLFARITPCLENGKIGQVPYELERVGGSTELVVLRAGPKVLPDFLFVWAAWDHTRHAAESLMTGTTGRQRVSAADLGRLAMKVPPLTEQQRIIDLIAGFDGSIVAAQRLASTSRQVRSALLTDLLSGNHEIPKSYDHLLEAS